MCDRRKTRSPLALLLLPASLLLCVSLRDAEAVGIRLASAERQQRRSVLFPPHGFELQFPGNVSADTVVSNEVLSANDESTISINQLCYFQMDQGENTTSKSK